MDQLSRLDNERATFRILLFLGYGYTSVPRSELIREVAELGVGRSALYSSLGTLNELKLIEEYRETQDGKRFVMTKLTKSGYEVAKKIIELNRFLEAI